MTIEHSVKGPQARFEISFFSLLLLVVALAVTACGGDSDDAGSGFGDDGGKESYLWVKTTEHDLRADLAVKSVNNLVFDEGATVMSTIVGGWAGVGDFGTITARLRLRTNHGEEIGPGTYTLTDSDERGTNQAKLELDFAGRSVVLDAGVLELQVLEIEPQEVNAFGGKLRRLRLEFDGSFTEPDEGGTESVVGEISFDGK